MSVAAEMIQGGQRMAPDLWIWEIANDIQGSSFGESRQRKAATRG